MALTCVETLWPAAMRAAARRSSMRPVGAGADEDAVDRDFFKRRAGLEAHVFEGALEGLAVVFVRRRRRGRARRR